MPGLGATFGRGAATTFQQDLASSDCILIMGSNMAEAHPVGFRYPIQAREKGATLIHVDPRFTRTSAMCDHFVAIRTGSDIAFLGGLINYVLTNDRWFTEYVLAYTNASTIIDQRFADTEDLDGLFSGFNRQNGQYDGAKGKWCYENSVTSQSNHGEPASAGGSSGSGAQSDQGIHGQNLQGGATSHSHRRGDPTSPAPGKQIAKDPTLQHPRCVLQLLKKHFGRYTPQLVSDICGCSIDEFHRVAQLLCDNSNRERTSAIVYAVGWTQHTTGVQIIRSAAILQTLLGNMGRPGGGIMAMRGHCSIQGSTDIATLYDLMPGYLPQPACDTSHESLDKYCEYEGLATGFWGNFRKFIVSMLKAWYGDAATRENDFQFDWLPRIDDDYSQLPFFKRMLDGNVEGYFIFGQNPAGGGPNAGLHRAGLRKLKWLVVLDWFEHETAAFWKDDPNSPPSHEIGTEVFFMPAASIAAKDGSFTNTQRLIQWHDKAVEPEGHCQSDLAFVYRLGLRLKKLYAGSSRPQDQAIQHLTWNYGVTDGNAEPSAERVLQEINGYHVATGKLLTGFHECKDDGSTAAGCWLYSGVFPESNRNRARERKITSNPLQPEWGYAWPANRRMMYNRCSADPDGKPWSERKRYVWWDASEQKWQGHDVPDFELTKPPTYRPPDGARGMDAIAGDAPFITKEDGVAHLFSPALKDGPFPAHYEAIESSVPNQMYPDQESNPTTRLFQGRLNELSTGDAFPIVATTFRLTEHYLSGPMSRFNSWLNELQPEMFVELSPELARERGIEHGGWLTVRSARGSIDARAMVTRRLKPLVINGRTLHQIGLPFHWGYSGEAVGAIANDLTSLVADPNVSMHEGKTFMCEVSAGRSGPRERPALKFAPWPTRDRAPQTPKSAQPEGQMQ